MLRTLAVLFAFLLSGATSRAQSLASSGQIEGVVTDSKGSTVPGAEVRVQNLGTGAVRTAESNEAGRFLFTGLPIGRYSLSVNAMGFASFKVELFFDVCLQSNLCKVSAFFDARTEGESVQGEEVLRVKRRPWEGWESTCESTIDRSTGRQCRAGSDEGGEFEEVSS